MTLEKANEIIQRPINGSTLHSTGTNLLYVEGRKAKKYNPIYYERMYGLKRWLKKVMKDAPPPEKFHATLRPTVAGNAVATTLQSLGVDGSLMEFADE